MEHYEKHQSPLKVQSRTRNSQGGCCCIFRPTPASEPPAPFVQQESSSEEKARDTLLISEERLKERPGVVICHQSDFSKLSKSFPKNLVLSFGPQSELQHYKCIRLTQCACVILPYSSVVQLIATTSPKFMLLIPRNKLNSVLEGVRRGLRQSFQGRTVQEKWQWLNWRLMQVDQENLLLERVILSFRQVAFQIYSKLSANPAPKLSSRLLSRIGRLRLETLSSLGTRQAESLGELLQTEQGSQGVSESSSQWEQLIFPETPTRRRIGSQDYKISFVQV